MQVNSPKPVEERKRREQLYKLIVANSDIADALKVTRHFIQEVSTMQHELYLPLQEVIIISYARPFTDNKPFGALPAKWGKFQNSRFQSLHNQLLEARHQYVAHSDHAIRKVTLIPPGNKLNILDNKRVADTSWEITNQRFELEVFSEIEQLCLDLGSRLYSEIKTQIGQLYPSTDAPGKHFSLLPEREEKSVIVTPYSES